MEQNQSKPAKDKGPFEKKLEPQQKQSLQFKHSQENYLIKRREKIIGGKNNRIQNLHDGTFKYPGHNLKYFIIFHVMKQENKTYYVFLKGKENQVQTWNEQNVRTGKNFKSTIIFILNETKQNMFQHMKIWTDKWRDAGEKQKQ